MTPFRHFHFPSRIASLALTACLALPVYGESVYRHVDEDGNVTFSDESQGEQSESIRIRSGDSISLPKPQSPSEDADNAEEEQAEAGYESLQITKPEHDTAFRNATGDVVIELSAEPALQDGHQFQLEFDGERRETSDEPRFELTNVDRGTHEITVHILNADGDTIHSSDTTRFTLHRPSRLHN